MPPLNTHTPTVECIYYCTPALCTSVLILTLCSRPCLPTRGPDQVLALAWVVGLGGRGGLGALKLSSGAPTALPAHPSWPASPQIDSSALLIRSLVTVGGRVCVDVCVCVDRRLYWLGVTLVCLFPSSLLWLFITTVYLDCILVPHSLLPLEILLHITCSKSYAHFFFTISSPVTPLFSISSL